MPVVVAAPRVRRPVDSGHGASVVPARPAPVEPVAGDDLRSDTALVAAARAGDVAAFEALYLRHRDWVVRCARRFTGDEHAALDVMQEVFAYLLRRIPTLVLTARLTTFLYPAIRHTALHARRRARREPTAGEDAPERAVAGVDPGGSRDELAAALAALSEDWRETLLLRFVDGLALQEIADAMGVPLGTVKSRLHKALAALREDPGARRHFGP